MAIFDLFSLGTPSAALDIRHPLWKRLAAIGSGTVLLACAAVAGLSWYKQTDIIDHAIETELSRMGDAVFAALAAQNRNAIAVATTIADEPGVADLVVAGDRKALIARYEKAMPGLKSQSSIQMLTFDKAPGIAVARIHAPAQFGDDMARRRHMVGAAINQGQPVMGIEPSLNGALSTFATVPLVAANGAIVGAVDVGTHLTNEYFQRLKQSYNIDLAIQTALDGGFKTQNATFAAQTYLSPKQAKAAFDGQAFRRIVEDGGQSLAVTAFPLTDFSGRRIGLLELVDNVTPIISQGRESLWVTIIGCAIVAALSLVAFFVFAISLSKPIRELTGAMKRLASGDLKTEIEGKGRADEIGAMASAVQVFKDNAIALEGANADRLRMEAAAEAERVRNEADRQKLAQDQEEMVHALAAALEHLSQGDLTSRIDAAFAAEYKKLKDDFNAAVDRLRQAMLVIAETTSGIKSGSGEITQASDDLARRTEQQAASLEETAAALDEITATVKKAAQGAGHARELVAATDQNAKQGAIVMRETIEAMDRIAKSAQQISQIIGVIDEIAFQTNLLALNAGVEAARAGDAGRGFAVVASEVRALAQRSAEAAKEIKGLISASSSQVDTGVKLVGESGKALEKIMLQMTEINDIVAGIATGAKEQATGLAEVNTALNQMDQVTQQNAAMVEESTAASHTLSQETEQLSSLIAQFRVTNHDDVMRDELKKVAPHAFKRAAAR